MFEFVLSVIASIITNVYIISPIWDTLKELGQIQNPAYYICCGVSYLGVGLIVFMVAKVVKWFFANK